MHHSPARLQNIAAVVKCLWHLEKETGTKNSRDLILALLVNYSVTLGKAFTLPFYRSSACVTAQTGTTGLTCQPGERAGMLNSSPGYTAAWLPLIPFVLPLEQTPGAPAPHTVNTLPRRCSPPIRLPPRVPASPRHSQGFICSPRLGFLPTPVAQLSTLALHQASRTKSNRTVFLLTDHKKLQGERCFTLLLCIHATDYKYNSGKSFIN